MFCRLISKSINLANRPTLIVCTTTYGSNLKVLAPLMRLCHDKAQCLLLYKRRNKIRTICVTKHCALLRKCCYKLSCAVTCSRFHYIYKNNFAIFVYGCHVLDLEYELLYRYNKGRITSIYQPKNANIISHKTLLKHSDMFRSRLIIIRELSSLLKLYYSIKNSIGICKRIVVAAYHVV